MKRIFKKLENNILAYTSIFTIFFVLLHFLFKLFNIRFRLWCYCLVATFMIVGIIVGTFQFLKEKSKKVKLVFFIIGVSIIIFVAVSWKTILVALDYTPEHIVTKNDKKYVAYVRAFLNVDVYYYDYINFFLVGDILKIYENYGNGGYDPFDGKHDMFEPLQYYYYDKKGEVIETNDEYYNKNLINNTTISDEKENSIKNFETTEKPLTQDDISETNEEDNAEEKEILYEKNINKKTSIRVMYVGAILGQRSVIVIEKTTDGGKTWNNQLETTDGYMTIHNGAKFVFIDENIGFINDPGLAGTSGENRGLLVTTDGGKNFTNIIMETNNLKEDLYIEDVPYKENNILKLKVYTIENYDKKYYYFYSEDNGISWKKDN